MMMATMPYCKFLTKTLSRTSNILHNANVPFISMIVNNCTKSSQRIPASVLISASRTYSSKKKLHVGDSLPDVNLFENTPDNAVSASELYKGKRGVLFAVVGAFTPGCTNTHIPDYLSLYEKFKEEGYMISCISVNDPFVMAAWGKSTGADGKIRMLADPSGEFTKTLGMDIDCTKLLGGIRSHKYSLVIEDGKIQSINVDAEATGLQCLLCIKNTKANDMLNAKRS